MRLRHILWAFILCSPLIGLAQSYHWDASSLGMAGKFALDAVTKATSAAHFFS